jgi:transposase-like protein
MSKKKFTSKQIQQLLNNDNVIKCSNKAISYGKDFKINAVKQYNENGLSPREIFKQSGFDPKVLGKQRISHCLLRWRKIFRTKGMTGLVSETRGRGRGRPKIKDLSDADKIKRLEVEVAYLKAENDFLAKLRASKKR